MDAAGRVVIPKGSLAELVLRSAVGGGVTSNAELALDLQSVRSGIRRYVVNTTDLEQKAQGGVGANKRTAEMVGAVRSRAPLSERLLAVAKAQPSEPWQEPGQVPGHKSLRVASLLRFQRKRH